MHKKNKFAYINYFREGAEYLIELRDIVREHNKNEHQVPLREPDLLIVLTGGKLAYTRRME